MNSKSTLQAIRIALTFATLTVVFSCSGAKAPSDTDAVRDFVQKFYDWYVPSSRASSDRPAEIVLRERPSAFDSTLARGLKEDSDAQSKVAGDIVGLDFDPFLAAQDPCERYELVGVRKSGESYLATVRGVGGCENHEEADVDAEVISRDGAWVFTNVRYPRLGGDLLTTLQKLRDDRKAN